GELGGRPSGQPTCPRKAPPQRPRGDRAPTPSEIPPLPRPPGEKSTPPRVPFLSAGGPAPAANAVISTAAVSFLRNGIEVIGILHGYSHLIEYSESNPLKEGRDFIPIDHKVLRRTRNSRGILLGTSRTNPGRLVTSMV